MVAALGKISEMEVAADKPSMAGVGPKLSKDRTLLRILGRIAMGVEMALGSVFHIGTGGVFLDNGSKKMGEKAEMAKEAQPFSSDSCVDPRYPKDSPDDPDDDPIDGYYRRGF